jgi:hypothetical protein
MSDSTDAANAAVAKLKQTVAERKTAVGMIVVGAVIAGVLAKQRAKKAAG